MLSKTLQARSITTKAELAPYVRSWRDLTASPMRSPAWLLGWWDTMAEAGDELRIIVLTDSGGDLVGLAPLYLQKQHKFATLRVLGARDNCTHHTDWISVAGSALLVGREVARFLLESRKDWQRLWLEAVDADAEAVHATMDYLTDHGCLSHRRPINSCWQIPLPETWDEYLQRLSRSLRKRCRKLQREFFDSERIKLRRVAGEDDLPKGFDVLLDLHAARWGTASRPLGVFTDSKFRTFHAQVARSLLNEGQLRLAWLEYQGKPIAVEYQFVDANAVYAYQAGLDLSMKECSPGKLSMMAAIQFAIERGCRTFDLLGGDEPYKRHWRAVPTGCHDLRIWQRGARARGEWVLWNVYTLAAEKLKPYLPENVVVRISQLSAKIKNLCVPRSRSGF